MKLLTTMSVMFCAAVLSACATPPADPNAESVLASNGAVFEDKGEVLTGSRIPQKSTAHVLKRVGSAEYKKAKADANAGAVSTGSWGR